MRVLVVNAGSSSLKLRLLEHAGSHTEPAAFIDLPALDPESARNPAFEAALAEIGPVDAVGHRIVHGGTELRAPVVVDDAVLDRLAALSDLAPLHQPRCVAGLRVARRPLPDVPHVACFDTAFHATLPPAAATYALPAAWRERWPLRRFGFHGLSHAWAARRAAELLGREPGSLRLVTCHLGAGASLAAVDRGRSVDTTMGFTPLEGLVMATRSGSVDPGLVLWLIEHAGLSAAEVSDGLEHGGGLAGLAGTSDMRQVLARADAGDGAARVALDVYVHSVRAGIAAMAAAIDGFDALVFTGGVGENAPAVRRAVVDGLGFLGVRLPDAGARDTNAAASHRDREIGDPDAPARTLVVASREDLEIARQVREVVGGRART